MTDGRGERIRTSDSCVPNAVLYQAELHPEADGGCRTDVQTPFFEDYREIQKTTRSETTVNRESR